jgi:glycosyltransferase involved in cell wall biosynthesis
MEAAACGTPTAALAVGGVQESVEDGRTGLLATDPEDLAGRIQLILRDPELRDSLGAAALERTRAFTWDATARRTLEVLEAQVAGRELRTADPAAVDAPAAAPDRTQV